MKFHRKRAMIHGKGLLASIRGALMAAALAAVAPAAIGAGLDLGTAANYTVISLGNGYTIGQNSGTVAGNELLGNGVTAGFAGGGGGAISGILYYDNTVKNTNTFSQLATPPTTQLVSTSVTQAVLASAQSVSAYAAGLTATQTYGNVSASTTFTGNGGLNVIDIANINNAPLKIVGGAKDTFVFNISGAYSTNAAMTLQGVSASQILFNFTATSGNVFQTAGGDASYGTYLATDGGNFQFSNLVLTGALINTAGNVQLVSGSGVGTFQKFASVPEANTFLFGVFLVGVIAVSRVRRPTAVAVG